MLVTQQPVLRRFWYPVMPLARLASPGAGLQPAAQPFTLLGEPIVLSLQADGQPAAVQLRDGQACRCQARYGHAWVALGEPLAPVMPIPEDGAAGYRRILQFNECWAAGALRLMENSFDAAHFPFVHRGTFGQFGKNKPEYFSLTETDYGFEAETRLVINNPPQAHRITGTTEPTTRRHFRNQWHLPFLRRLGLVYPNGLEHLIITSATPIDDGHIQVIQWVYRNDTEAECPADEINAWDQAVVLEDKVILESTDPDAPVTLARRTEENMRSDQPGLLMRKRLLALLQAHGEREVYRSRVPGHPSLVYPPTE